MNKKVIIIVAGAVVAILLAILWFTGRNIHVLEDVNPSDIKEVYFSNPANNMTITDADDIKKIVDLISSMELDKTISSNKDGFGYDIRIYYKDGKETTIVFASEIIVDSQCYDSDEEYYDEVGALFDELSEVYTLESN